MQNFKIIIIILCLLTTACTMKTRRSLEDGQPTTTADSDSESSTENMEPKGQKVGLILGPGGVRAFAHTGVIKELNKANIPIDMVIGIEWGALVGALYAQNGKVHEAEWQLYKLEKKEIPGRSFLTNKFEASSIKVLSPFLKRSFKSSSVGGSKLVFACPSLSIWSGSVVWQDRGRMGDAVQKCLPYPPIFKPQSPWMASAFSVRSAIDYMKKRGVDIVILVNVLDQGELLIKKDVLEEYQASILWQEIRRRLNEDKGFATEVIDVKAKRYKLFDFNDRRSIVVAGERAGRKAAPKIAEKYGF